MDVVAAKEVTRINMGTDSFIVRLDIFLHHYLPHWLTEPLPASVYLILCEQYRILAT